jgi:protocatechuate 3,4-dioxygenase beta subunit
MLLKLLLAFQRARRLLAGATPATNTAMQRALEEAADKLGLRRAPSLRTSPAVRFPVVWCWGVRPIVLMPDREARASTPVDWVAVFCHELAHWSRRDHVTSLLGELSVVVLPWHPLAWWAKRRLAELGDQACDDRVLAAGRPETEYAESLLSLRVQDRPTLALAAVTSRKSLARRLLRILSVRRSEPAAGLGWTLTATLVTAALITAMALAQPRSRAAEEAPESAELTSAEARPSGPEQEEATQPTVTLAGQVLDPGGRPVAGVRIRSDLIVLKPRREVKLDEARTTTDDQGRFELRGVAKLDKQRVLRRLVFEHPEFAIGWFKPYWHRDVDPAQIRITLVSPTTVGGLVTDEQGRPVAGAAVEASLQYFSEGAYGYLQMTRENRMAATTDARGKFAFEKIPEGARLHISVFHPTYATFRTEDGYQGSTHPIKAGDRSVGVELAPGGTIRGRLVRGGKPLDWKRVQIKAALPGTTDLAAYTETDVQGRFTLTGLSSGQYVVFAEKDHLPDAGVVCTPARDVRVKAGEEVELDLLCTEGRVLTGRVLEEQTGRPVSEQTVTARVGANFRIEVNRAATDEEGRYRLRLPPGKYHVQTHGWRDGLPRAVTADVTIEPQGALAEVDFRVGVRRQWKGRLVDEEGRPVEGKVALRRESADTAKDGSFVAPALGGGMERAGFAFSRDKKLAAAFYMSRFEPGVEQRIVLRPVAEVRGVVIEVTSVPVFGAEVRLGIRSEDGKGGTLLGRPPWQRKVGPGGAFAFSGIPTGLPMWLSIRKPGYEPISEELGDMQPGGVRSLVSVAHRRVKDGVPVEHDAAIAGRVVDEHKKPVAGARVGADVRELSSYDYTDVHGAFSLEKLPPNETARVFVEYRGYGWKWFSDVQTGHDGLELQIFPSGYERFGKPALELDVAKWLTGEPITLEKLRGKVVLLHVGVDARRYHLHVGGIRALAEKHADELVVIGIHQRLERQFPPNFTEEEIVEMLEEHRITYPFAIDGDTDATYDVKDSPAVILIDKKGIVRPCPRQTPLETRVAELVAE